MKEKLFSNRASAIALAMIVSMLWGTLFPTIKIGYRVFGIDSTQVASILLFAGLRFLISGILLVGAHGAKKGRIELPSCHCLGAIFVVSMLTVVVHYALTYTGLALAESSKSAVLKQIGFLVVPGVAFLFRKEDKCSVRKVAAALLGFASVIAVSLDGFSLVFGLGEILVILASFSSMFGQLISKNVYDKYEPTYIVAWAQLLGGVILVAAGLLLGGAITTVSLLSVAVLGYMCLASITANILWNTLIKYNDMSRLAVLKAMDPLFAAVFSAALLGENILKPTYLLSVILLITAITVSSYKSAPKKVNACAEGEHI